uniref:Uncharacterized protein n=1 Tax=Myotis myotis TaxID=51298 RepID=A0A7J7ZXR0_MYOMY|nr:hypothetical protein mMyoMyo1_009740 [Myotis myotis]
MKILGEKMLLSEEDPQGTLSPGHLDFPWSQGQVNRPLFSKVCAQGGFVPWKDLYPPPPFPSEFYHPSRFSSSVICLLAKPSV